MFKRLFMIVVGAFILFANAQGEEGTVLGFYPPENSERIGFNAAKLALAALGIWAVYRGIKPKRVVVKAPEQPT